MCSVVVNPAMCFVTTLILMVQVAGTTIHSVLRAVTVVKVKSQTKIWQVKGQAVSIKVL